MTIELIVRIFIEQKITDIEKQKLQEFINSIEYLHQGWITSGQFDHDMKAISTEFKDLSFHCIYYTDGWQYVLNDDCWKNGEHNDTKITNDDSVLIKIEEVFNYFANKDDQKYDSIVGILQQEANELRTTCINEYVKSEWLEITYMLPENR